MDLIDTHVHLDLDAFDPDRPMVLERARVAGVGELVLPGVTRARWPDLDALHRQYAGLHVAYGLHPIFLQDHADADLDALETWLDAHPETVAVGEIGLDGSQEDLDWDRQWHYYTRQLAIARERDLPVIIHSRRALDEVLKGLRQYEGVTGILHAFIGSPQQARQAVDLGCCLGIGGPVTYERAKKLHRVVREAPLEALVVETDAPDQPLAGHQGERNEPAMTAGVNRRLAALRDMDPTEMAIITSQNARRILRLPTGPRA
ncbi:TatD family hydrolase [Thioalkalivibrio sp.]|uniref:TatD family hydrolase n=1 Tax=Thioalkalivibrio sp. TaxID=2093813 RepID=UPI00356464BE